jgi:hypothetical protein
MLPKSTRFYELAFTGLRKKELNTTLQNKTTLLQAG